MNKYNIKNMTLTIVAILIICLSGSINAANTAKGKITFYGTGWKVNTVRVQTTAPFVGQSCGIRTDGYHTDPAQSGNATHQAALLMAYQNKKWVQLILEGCYAGVPKIIGVYVTDF